MKLIEEQKALIEQQSASVLSLKEKLAASQHELSQAHITAVKLLENGRVEAEEL